MLSTDLTIQFGLKHPVVLAGMGEASGPELVAAVSNAGGLGVFGGALYTPTQLKDLLDEVKSYLHSPDLPFGVDLLIPQIGGNARKTNIDYTRGKLDELIDVVIESGAKLFVSAVGVAPKPIIQKLQRAGVLYGNMVGHPKHVHKACSAGADLIVAQGGEAGGHTGDIPTSILTPACADICEQYISPVTKKPVLLITGGGVYGGRSLASALMLGASAVWVGTRFVTAKESGASEAAKKAIVDANFEATIRTLIFTGRPLRTKTTPYIAHWESARQDEIRRLTSLGVIPIEQELEHLDRAGKLSEELEEQATKRPMGIVSALVTQMNMPAKDIVDEIVTDAERQLSGASSYVISASRL